MHQIDAEGAFGSEDEPLLGALAKMKMQILKEHENRRGHGKHAERRIGSKDGADRACRCGMPAGQPQRAEQADKTGGINQTARLFGQRTVKNCLLRKIKSLNALFDFCAMFVIITIETQKAADRRLAQNIAYSLK